MSEESKLEVLKQEVLALAKEAETYAERVDLLQQKVAALVPEEDAEEMVDGRKPKSPAFLLSERLWLVVTEYLEPAASLLRSEPKEEPVKPDASLDEVHAVMDRALALLDEEESPQMIQAFKELRKLAVEIDAVNRLRAEWERRSILARLAFGRIVMELLPQARRFAQVFGVPRSEAIDDSQETAQAGGA